MFRNYVFTLSLLLLLVMGQAATARAADSAAPSYPRLGRSRRPCLPSCPPLEQPYRRSRAIENVWTRNDRPNADGGGLVQSAREGRMVVKRRRRYLDCKERRCTNPDFKTFLR
jgi:hypothetical protein